MTTPNNHSVFHDEGAKRNYTHYYTDMQKTATSKERGYMCSEPFNKHTRWSVLRSLWTCQISFASITMSGMHQQNTPQCRRGVGLSILPPMMAWTNLLLSLVCGMYSWVFLSRKCKGGLNNVSRMRWITRYKHFTTAKTIMPMIW